MKIKFSVGYLLCFLCLVFLIHELQDWTNFLISQWVCGCVGAKTLGAWTVCEHCDVTGKVLFFAWMAGPVVSYCIILLSWSILETTTNNNLKSFAVSLFFATLPLGKIIYTLAGKSSEALAFREIFQHGESGYSLVAVLAGLLMILAVMLPAFMKIVKLIREIKETMVILGFLLLAPVLLDYLVYSLLRKASVFDMTKDDLIPDISLLALFWLIFCTLYFAFNHKKLYSLIRKKNEHHKRRRHHRKRIDFTSEEPLP